MNELIPSIDLRRGQVIRLLKGDDRERTIYQREPRQLLEDFAAAGIRLVHVVDLDAAFGEPPQRGLIESMLRDAPVALELGGGLRDEEAIAWALGAGCERIVLGSMVARETDKFLGLTEKYPDRLVPAIEVKDGALKVSGWVESASTTLEALCTALRGAPCPAALVTDVARDGTMAGPNIELAQEVSRATGFDSLVSGGVRSIADLERVANEPHIGGVIFGRAFYEGAFTIEEALQAFHAARGTAGGDA